METPSERLLGDVTVFIDRYNHLERENERLRASQVNANRFYAVAFGVDVVSKMHDVSPYLVREYVKMGLIPQDKFNFLWVVDFPMFEQDEDGNLKAIGKLLEGREATEAIRLLKGNDCGGRGTSCADQLACALEEALEEEKSA